MYMSFYILVNPYLSDRLGAGFKNSSEVLAPRM